MVPPCRSHGLLLANWRKLIGKPIPARAAAGTTIADASATVASMELPALKGDTRQTDDLHARLSCVEAASRIVAQGEIPPHGSEGYAFCIADFLIRQGHPAASVAYFFERRSLANMLSVLLSLECPS